MDRSKAAECGDKQAHPDRQGALDHRAALVRGGAPPWRLVAYRCRHCGAWHVGHRPKPRKVRR